MATDSHMLQQQAPTLITFHETCMNGFQSLTLRASRKSRIVEMRMQTAYQLQKQRAGEYLPWHLKPHSSNIQQGGVVARYCFGGGIKNAFFTMFNATATSHNQTFLLAL